MSNLPIVQDNIDKQSLEDQVLEIKNDVSLRDTAVDDQKNRHLPSKLAEKGILLDNYPEDRIKIKVFSNQIQGDDWHIIADEISTMQHPLQQLDLYLNSTEESDDKSVESGFIEFAKAIQGHKSLEKLSIVSEDISEDTKFSTLFEVLKDNCTITHLSIESKKFSFETACAFVKMLTNNQTLLFLDISLLAGTNKVKTPCFPRKMRITDETVLELGRSLQTTVIQRLTIKEIDAHGFKILAPFLPMTLVYLDLADNNIDEDSIPIIHSYLQANGSTLKELILDEKIPILYLQEQALLSSSIIKITSDSSLEASIFRKSKTMYLTAAETDDSSWSLLANELTKDDTTCCELNFKCYDEFNLDYLKYFKYLFGEQSRLTTLILIDRIQDASVQSELFRQLKENKSITTLRISFKMNAKFLHELVNLLENNNIITSLDLMNSSNMADENIIILADGLKNNIVLQRLHMEEDCLVRDNGFQILLSSLPSSLSYLLFPGSLITAKSLSPLLTFIKTHSSLKKVSIAENGINSCNSSEINVCDLLEQIVEITNTNNCIFELKINEKVKEILAKLTNDNIDLTSARLHDDHIFELCNEIKKEPERNWSLNLSSNPLISHVGYRFLANILSSTISLIELSVADNKMNDDARAIFLHGIANNKTLRKFNLVGNKINNEDVEYIIKFLENNPVLEEINLTRCFTAYHSAVQLAEVLPENNLEKLGVDLNSIADLECASDLFSLPPTLKHSSINHNQITEISLQSYFTVLTANRTLKTLDLNQNSVFGVQPWEKDNKLCWQQLNLTSKENNISDLK